MSGRLETTSEYWHWTWASQPRFDTDGATLREALEYIARETGRELHYGSDAVKLGATRERLVGSYPTKDPQAVLEILSEFSEYELAIDEGYYITVDFKR